MQTTKKSPFSQFDPNYYATLRKVSFAKAEEYRKTVIQGTKNTIDLGARFGQEPLNELAVRGITPENKDGMEKREILKARGGIDLAEQFEQGKLGAGNPLETNPEELKQEPSIDLSLLITDPGAISEEEILGRSIPEWEEEANEGSTENREIEAGDDIDVPTKNTEYSRSGEATWEEQHNNNLENNDDEKEKLGEKEREYLIKQLNAKWILTAKNIGDKKLIEKATKAWLL